MAAARLAGLGPHALTAGDVAALLDHPDVLAGTGYTADQLPADAPERPTGPTGLERAGGYTHLRPSLPTPHPEFDGATYRRHPDYVRLGAQARRVWDAISDGAWHTLADLSAATGDPEASISARLRDFRKEQWGGHSIERTRVAMDAGQYRYRLITAPQGTTT